MTGSIRHTLRFPMERSCDEHLRGPAGVRELAIAAEELGFFSIAFTDHPAPSAKWMSQGGHESFDPLTALAFAAATTTRLRLMTYLLVLPYRNPLLAAKQAQTVDRLSGGRLTMVAGAGYLRSEFAALGVDFDTRNDLFDEALETMQQAWASTDFKKVGRGFEARGVVAAPLPVQERPPLWIGGNSRRARRRAASAGQGWSPILTDGVLARTTRTKALSTPDDLTVAVQDLHALARAEGRDPAELAVQVEWKGVTDLASGIDRAGRGIEELGAAGATHVGYEPAGDTIDAALWSMQRYADSFLG